MYMLAHSRSFKFIFRLELWIFNSQLSATYIFLPIYEFPLLKEEKSVNITVKLEIFSREQLHCIFSVGRLFCQLNPLPLSTENWNAVKN